MTCVQEKQTKTGEYWKRWKANARGVDLNRNFDSGWRSFQGASMPSADHYKGPYPGSEPEVEAILSVAEEYPLACTLSYHSSGNVIYWDYGCGGELLERERKLARLAGRVTGYEQVSSIQDAQDAAGCSDYFVLERGIPSVTIENGAGECPLSMEEYPAIWSANRFLWPALARFLPDNGAGLTVGCPFYGNSLTFVYRIDITALSLVEGSRMDERKKYIRKVYH